MISSSRAAEESRRGRPLRSNPFGPELIHVRGHRQAFGRSLIDGSGEGGHPRRDPAVPELDEATDVALRSRGQHDRDGRHEYRRQASAPEDGMDEAAADATVAIREWMDGLELGVSDRGHGDRRDVVARQEGHEVIDEALAPHPRVAGCSPLRAGWPLGRRSNPE